MKGHLCFTRDYKAGEPRPSGYNAVMEWDAAQRKGGLLPRPCAVCGNRIYPQETCCKPAAPPAGAEGGRDGG